MTFPKRKPASPDVPRTRSSPAIELASEVLAQLRASIRALEASNDREATRSALEQASMSAARLHDAASALSDTNDPEST